ncbi:MAG: carbohydrate-binding family 9-like protein [Chthoniobacterales bacterium]
MENASLYSSEARMTAKFAGQDFVLDGSLGKSLWQTAPRISFDHDVYAAAAYPESATEAAALWTESSVYFAFRCRYSKLHTYEGEDPAKERWQLWERDVVEVFINPRPDVMSHYYEFEVSPNNQWIDLKIDKTKDPFYDAGWDSGFAHATLINTECHVWNCEMRLPIASMGVGEIVPGDEWRVNFYRADGSGDDSPRRLTSWCSVPGGDTFHSPARFGLIRFE